MLVANILFEPVIWEQNYWELNCYFDLIFHIVLNIRSEVVFLKSILVFLAFQVHSEPVIAEHVHTYIYAHTDRNGYL